jgi:hypothetical protein
MDDPRRLTRSGHTRQKAHPLLPRVFDQHKLMCVERRTRQPITRDMIDFMMYLDQHAASVGTASWTNSWSAHCNWMILGLFTASTDKRITALTETVPKVHAATDQVNSQGPL